MRRLLPLNAPSVPARGRRKSRCVPIRGVRGGWGVLGAGLLAGLFLLALGSPAQAEETSHVDFTPGSKPAPQQDLRPEEGAVRAGVTAPTRETEPRSQRPDATAGTLVMPFEREVGDRWGIVIQRTVRRFDGGLSRERRVMDATIRAPRGTGWLVALAYTRLELDDRVIDLAKQDAATQAQRDRLGGGLLLLAVDGRGTATRVLNHKAVGEALERHARTQGRKTVASASLSALLADWNTVYAACGVEFTAGEIQRRKIAVDVVGGDALEGAQARRLARETAGRRELVFTSHARFGAEAPATAAQTSADVAYQTNAATRGDPSDWGIEDKERIRFDEDTRRIEGKHLRTIRAGARQATILVRFHETALPDA